MVEALLSDGKQARDFSLFWDLLHQVNSSIYVFKSASFICHGKQNPFLQLKISCSYKHKNHFSQITRPTSSGSPDIRSVFPQILIPRPLKDPFVPMELKPWICIAGWGEFLINQHEKVCGAKRERESLEFTNRNAEADGTLPSVS